MRAHPGLSIVEVLVALMLVTIALLGMAGSTTLALRQVNDAASRRAATHGALTRFGVLAAEGCLRATADPQRGIREHWIVTGDANFARISDTLAWTSPRGPRVISLDFAFAC